MFKYLNSLFRLVILSGLLILTAACSNKLVGETGIIRDRSSDYVKGETLPALKMPPNVVQLPPDPYFVIPDVQNKTTGPVSLVPPRV